MLVKELSMKLLYDNNQFIFSILIFKLGIQKYAFFQKKD